MKYVQTHLTFLVAFSRVGFFFLKRSNYPAVWNAFKRLPSTESVFQVPIIKQI